MMNLTDINLRKLTINICSHSCIWNDDTWRSNAPIETQSRLFFIKYGKLNYEIEGKKYVVTKNQLMLIPENRHVKYYVSKDDAVHLHTCNFNAVIGEEGLWDYMDGEWVIDAENPKHIEALFERFHKVDENNIILDSLEKKRALLEILCIFMRTAGLNAVGKKNSCGKLNLDGIADYIRRNANSKTEVNVKNLANMAHVAYNYFISEFSRYFGMSPMQYILEERINSAKHLLSNTDLPIKQIAENMHFENVKYFSTFFKKRTGYTPREYRGLNKKV